MSFLTWLNAANMREPPYRQMANDQIAARPPPAIRGQHPADRTLAPDPLIPSSSHLNQSPQTVSPTTSSSSSPSSSAPVAATLMTRTSMVVQGDKDNAEDLSQSAESASSAIRCEIQNESPVSLSSYVADAAPSLSPLQIKKAVTLLSDALRSAPSFEIDDDLHFRSYALYNAWGLKVMVDLVVVIHLALALVEEPNGSLNLKIPEAAALAIEAFCLIVYGLRTLHTYYLTPKDVFWRDAKVHLFIFCMATTWIDMIVFASLNFHAPRWSRALRPIFMCTLSNFRQIRRSFRAIRRTVVSVASVFFLLLLTIAFFALVMLKLFTTKGILDQKGDPYMSNYLDIYYDLYVLMTTSNFPDIMMPAMDRNEAYVVVFVIFVVIATYVFVSVFLAVVYENYKNHLESEVVTQFSLELTNMTKCFNLIAEKRRCMSKAQWVQLVAKSQSVTSEKAELLWGVIAGSSDTIDKSTFLKTVDLLDLVVKPASPGLNWFDRVIPSMYHSRASEAIKRAVNHNLFGVFFDVVIVVNAIMLGINVNHAEAMFLVLFNLEMLLKLYTFGFKRFFSKRWNIFDILVIMAASILRIYEIYDTHERNIVDIVLTLRLLRLVKVIRRFQRFKVIVNTLAQILPALGTYAVMLFVIYYMYAIAGMTLFGNLIYEGHGNNKTGSLFDQNSEFFKDIHKKNPKLAGTDFALAGYYQNNFNDIVAAFIVLFELMVVNQWNVLADGYVVLTSKAARVYFASFHAVVVLVMVNIFIAFVLETFLLQLQLVLMPDEDAFAKHVRRYLSKHRDRTGRLYKVEVKPGNTSAVYRRLFKETRLRLALESESPSDRNISELQDHIHMVASSVPDEADGHFIDLNGGYSESSV
eukprot:m.173006 g.173006  ORF g.173006 m.173006 type:complete len:865 (+) comp16523_c0_seq7:147-2741(+)